MKKKIKNVVIAVVIFLSVLPFSVSASESLDAYYDTGDDAQSDVDSMQAQVFTAIGSGDVPYVDLLVNVGGCVGNMYVDLRTTTGGAPSTGAQTNVASVSCGAMSGTNWVRFTFPIPELIVASSVYAITFTGDNTLVRFDSTASEYTGGERYYCTSESPEATCNTWLIQTGDFMFRVYMTDAEAPPALVATSTELSVLQQGVITMQGFLVLISLFLGIIFVRLVTT